MTCVSGGDPPTDCEQTVESEKCPYAVNVSPTTVPSVDVAASSGTAARNEHFDVFNSDFSSCSS